MGDIFREIDEELKQERFDRFLKKHGKLLIGAAVLFVLAVAGWKFWEQQQISARHAEGQKFAAAAALIQDGKLAEARAAFAALGAETGSGYGILARFYQAALTGKNGDSAGAAAAYGKIAGDGAVPEALRGLAVVLGALHALRAENADVAAIRGSLQGLTGAGKPYRHAALELMAVAAQKAGNISQAKDDYRAIVDDPSAPAGIRGRASQMLNILGAPTS